MVKHDLKILRELSMELSKGDFLNDDVACEFLDELTQWVRFDDQEQGYGFAWGFAWSIKTLAGSYRRQAQQLSSYAKMLSADIREIPPYINHADALTATLARWRLKQGV
jgi:hypothetical protein